MAPHMSNAELDRATALHAAGKTPVEVHALLQRPRAARGQSGPDLTTVRRAPGGGGLGRSTTSIHEYLFCPPGALKSG